MTQVSTNGSSHVITLFGLDALEVSRETGTLPMVYCGVDGDSDAVYAEGTVEAGARAIVKYRDITPERRDFSLLLGSPWRAVFLEIDAAEYAAFRKAKGIVVDPGARAALLDQLIGASADTAKFILGALGMTSLPLRLSQQSSGSGFWSDRLFALADKTRARGNVATADQLAESAVKLTRGESEFSCVLESIGMSDEEIRAEIALVFDALAEANARLAA